MSEPEKTQNAQEVAEILDVVTARVPALLQSLRDLLYSPEAARNMGQAVGTFYKELVNAGIPKEEAMSLTRDYLSTLKVVSDLGNVNINK